MTELGVKCVQYTHPPKKLGHGVYHLKNDGYQLSYLLYHFIPHFSIDDIPKYYQLPWQKLTTMIYP